MSLFVLDSDMVTLHYHRHPAVFSRIQATPSGSLATTIINVEELTFGWLSLVRSAKTRTKQARAYKGWSATLELIAGWLILPFSEAAMLDYDQLRIMKLNIGKNDMRIAAITRDFGGTLVTRNQRDFRRVPNPQIEDWSV